MLWMVPSILLRYQEILRRFFRWNNYMGFPQPYEYCGWILLIPILIMDMMFKLVTF